LNNSSQTVEKKSCEEKKEVEEEKKKREKTGPGQGRTSVRARNQQEFLGGEKAAPKGKEMQQKGVSEKRCIKTHD